jgi:hypothetical protein
MNFRDLDNTSSYVKITHQHGDLLSYLCPSARLTNDSPTRLLASVLMTSLSSVLAKSPAPDRTDLYAACHYVQNHQRGASKPLL